MVLVIYLPYDQRLWYKIMNVYIESRSRIFPKTFESHESITTEVPSSVEFDESISFVS